MSNILNDQQRKGGLLELARELGMDVGNAPDRTSKMFMMLNSSKQLPRDPLRGTSGQVNNLAMEDFAREKKLFILKPRGIRGNLMVPIEQAMATSFSPERIEVFREGYAAPEYLEVPLSSKPVVPKYSPPAYIGEPDNWMLIGITAAVETRGRDERDIQVLKEARNVVATTTYGSGTLKGMLERMSEMRAVRNGLTFTKTNGEVVKFNKPKSMTELKISLETFCRLMERFLPVSEAPEDFPPLGAVQNQFVLNEMISALDGEPVNRWNGTYIPEVSFDTSAGVPFFGKKKKERIWDAINLAALFIDSLRGAIAAGKSDKEISETLDDKWFWLGMGTLFPKAEPYANSKWLTSTRNIWNAPFVTHLLISLISSPVLRYSGQNLLNHDTPSMLGLSLMHGGMDKLINKMLGEPTTTAYVYSDNIYVVYVENGRRSYYSLDLVKGEANVEATRAQYLLYYLLTRGWANEETLRFTPAWAFFAMRVAPNLIVDTIGLLGNVQFQIPGQGSGNPLTAQLNHVSSAIFVAEWESKGSPRPGSPAFKQVEAAVGINIQVELEHEDLESVLSAARQSPANVDGGGGTEVELDLLGWNAVFHASTGEWVPVLARERLFKSMMLPKTERGKMLEIATKVSGLDPAGLKSKAGNDLVNKIADVITHSIQCVRYEALFVVGAWNIPIIREVLCENIVALRRIIDANKHLFGEEDQVLVLRKYGATLDLLTGLEDILDDLDAVSHQLEPKAVDEDLSRLTQRVFAQKTGRDPLLTRPQNRLSTELGKAKLVTGSTAERARLVLFATMTKKAQDLMAELKRIRDEPDQVVDKWRRELEQSTDWGDQVEIEEKLLDPTRYLAEEEQTVTKRLVAMINLSAGLETRMFGPNALQASLRTRKPERAKPGDEVAKQPRVTAPGSLFETQPETYLTKGQLGELRAEQHMVNEFARLNAKPVVVSVESAKDRWKEKKKVTERSLRERLEAITMSARR